MSTSGTCVQWWIRLAVISVVLSSLAVAGFWQSASAFSCAGPEPIDVFDVTLDDLASPNLNDPEGPLKARWELALQQTGMTVDSPEWADPPTISGVYVYETVAAIEEDGGWNRGSVSVVTDMWGEPPEDLRPRKHNTVDNKKADNLDDGCGPQPNGPQLGARKFFLVTSHGYAPFKPDRGPLTILANVFGPPGQAERDLQLEQELYEELKATRPTAIGGFGKGDTGVLLGIGTTVVTLGAVFILAYRRRTTTG